MDFTEVVYRRDGEDVSTVVRTLIQYGHCKAKSQREKLGR